MYRCALVTDRQSLEVDFDMPLIVDAASAMNIDAVVAEWDDSNVNWIDFDLIVLRSPWDYTNRLDNFLSWCELVSQSSKLLNPLDILKWNLNKRYLVSLLEGNVPTVPTYITEPTKSPANSLDEFFLLFPNISDFVVKPLVGAYSRDVKRFHKEYFSEAVLHIGYLHSLGLSVLIQPYLNSVDTYGETDLIFIDGEFSHAIRKGALLLKDGTVNPPDFQFRSERNASEAEIAVAKQALQFVNIKFSLTDPLLYARVDIVHDDNNNPVVLELEISEPSLSMPIYKPSAMEFCKAIKKRLACL